MGIHTFDKTWTYVTGAKTVRPDGIELITAVNVRLDAVDQANSEVTYSEEFTRSIDYHYLKHTDPMPDSFVPVDEITNQQMIDWFLKDTLLSDVDAWLTWQIYGWEEVSPYNEDNPAP